MSGTIVKICGLTRAVDVDAAVEAGADALGFVFALSKRRIGLERARELAERVPGPVIRVGLFMNQQEQEIRDLIEHVPLELLQFHGSENNRFCRCFGLPFIKSVSMAEGEPASPALAFPDAAGVLFDSHSPGAAGGTGRTFQWTLVPDCQKPVWLAGGLHAGNVAEAIRIARPRAVDVSSGVEDEPGIKNVEQMRAFVRAAKSTPVTAGGYSGAP